MTNLLSITARADAPIACEMRGAADTLAERLAEYKRLFEHALSSRQSTATTTFRLAARSDVVEWVLDLVRREAACCPFLSYEVDQEDEELVWTTTGLGAADIAMLDVFLAGADPETEDSQDLARRLTESSGIPFIVPAAPR